MAPSQIPPDIAVDRGGRYTVPCRTCGRPRRLCWRGPATHEERIAAECRSCYLRRVRIALDERGRYPVPCLTCGRSRLLLWHGLVAHEQHRQAECRSCASHRNCIFDRIERGTYIEPDPDPVAVDLLVRGGDPQLRSLPCERRLAAVELWRRWPSLTNREVAERLNVSHRTAERYRAELRLSHAA